MYLTVLLLAITFIGIAFIGMATQILLKKLILKKKGAFPQTKVGHNTVMKKKGIHCINVQQKLIDKQIKCEQEKNKSVCEGCIGV